MLFNSFSFLVFLPVVFFLHWFACSKTKATQNLFLLVASYFFYSYWDWRFLFLLVFSTFLGYSTGIAIGDAQTPAKRKLWLRFSVIMNIGLLCYFKYFNFFIDSFVEGFNLMGLHLDTWSLSIILPIGISFYTFHGLSYVLDIYYKRIEPHRNFVDYSLFVSYFPLLVAGPIERATHLLPQLKEKRSFSYAQGVGGLRFILLGMFKKVVIADSLAPIVSYIFENYGDQSSTTLIIGIIAFSLQVYGDFSGYSDIARGVSRLFGIELINNFHFPYFSRNIAEFWNRWHISLSSWLSDYIFTPLALEFRYWERHGIFLSIFITFLIAGFWHGAGWRFITYGAIHGLFFLPIIYMGKGLKSMISRKQTPYKLSDAWKIMLTYAAVCTGYIFFRADSVWVAFSYLQRIGVDMAKNPGQLLHMPAYKTVFIYMIFLFIADWWLMRDKNIYNTKINIAVNICIYYVACYEIFNSFGSNNTFIYFKF